MSIETTDADIVEAAHEHEAPTPQTNRVVLQLLRNVGFVTGMSMLVLLVALSLAAPLIARYDPNAQNYLPGMLNGSPSGAHWFGTDYVGRDLWARVLYGGRVSLPAGLGVVLVGAGIGVPLGLLAGYIGGLTDDVFMRFMDILFAFPGIILAIFVIGILSPGLTSAVLAIGITAIPFFARFVRGSTLAMREQDYVTAAITLGTRHAKIIRRHILPNVLGPVTILCATTFGYAILATAALSYLGLGSAPPTSDWGTLVYEGYQHMFDAASEVIFPGLAIVCTVLAMNLIADALTDAFNPR